VFQCHQRKKEANKQAPDTDCALQTIYLQEANAKDQLVVHDTDSLHRFEIAPPPGRAKTGECLCTVKWIWESLQMVVCDWNENGFRETY
jgi:hypothetical protein